MAYLLEKRMSALPSPREKGRTAMATFLLSSVKSREGGHGLCHHLLEKTWPPSSFPQWRVVKVAMASAIIF